MKIYIIIENLRTLSLSLITNVINFIYYDTKYVMIFLRELKVSKVRSTFVIINMVPYLLLHIYERRYLFIIITKQGIILLVSPRYCVTLFPRDFVERDPHEQIVTTLYKLAQNH